MRPFIQSKSSNLTEDDTLYELRGVLLHKGTSAYHGHYEAQVYDELYMLALFFLGDLLTAFEAKTTGTSSMMKMCRNLCLSTTWQLVILGSQLCCPMMKIRSEFKSPSRSG